MSRQYLKLILTVAVSLTTLLSIRLYIEPQVATELIRKAGYWFMLGTVILTIFVCAETFRKHSLNIKKILKEHGWGILVIIVCSIYTHLHEPHMFKVHMDEPVLSAMAKYMHEYRVPAVPHRGHVLEDDLYLINAYVDKRPYFFPFVLSTIHDLVGYRKINVFILNGILTLTLFTGIYAWCRRISTQRIAIFCLLLFTSLPLLAQNLTGGGFEVMNLVMLLALLLSMWYYLSRRGVEGLNMMILVSVLLAQTRYESILFTVPVALCIIIKWCREKSITLTWLSALAPVLLAPALLVQKNFFASKIFWQLKEGEGNPFGLEFLEPNLEKAVYYFFNVSHHETNSVILSLVIVIVLIALPIVYKRNPEYFKTGKAEICYLLVLPFILINFLLLMLYHWGQMTDPVVSRLGLPLMLGGLLGAPLVIRELLRGKQLPHLASLAVLAFILGFTSWANSTSYYTTRFISPQEVKLLKETVAEKYQGKNVLVLGASPVPYLIEGFASLSQHFLILSHKKIDYCLEQGIYDEVLLVRRFVVNPKTFELVETMEDPLGLFFESEEINRKWFRVHVVSTISRVTGTKELSDETRKERLSEEFIDALDDEGRQDVFYMQTSDPTEGFDNIDEYILHRQKMLP